MSFYNMDEIADCKRCGHPFEKKTWNQEYCPACKTAHRNERVLANRHRKYPNGKTRKHHVWTDSRRFSFYMDATWQSAICPICIQHMSACQCSASDPGLRRYEPQPAQTWEPWK